MRVNRSQGHSNQSTGQLRFGRLGQTESTRSNPVNNELTRSTQPAHSTLRHEDSVKNLGRKHLFRSLFRILLT
ncbi:hypothetical protein HanPSC8_Chr01g0004861 [Helianthus annuus]|nr:hypothetical protein HanPSC8_Chr01g0004861 [Helianthus annuus]